MLTLKCIILFLFCQSDYITSGEISYEIPLYSSKTPYNWLLDSQGPLNEDEFVKVRTQDGQTCKPAFFNLNARHGARYPSAHDMNGFTKLHTTLMGAAPSIRNDELRKWSNKYHPTDALRLTLLGEMEHTSLGRRFAMRFRFLFSRRSECEFNAVESDRTRTQTSAFAFFNGFMRVVKGVRMNRSCFKINVRNDLTHFHSLCAKYEKDVKHNAATLREQDEFYGGLLMKNLAADISKKLTKKDDAFDSRK